MTPTLKLHRIAFAMALPAGLLCLLAGLLVADLQQKRQDAEQRAKVATELSVVRTRLEGIVEATSSLTVGLSNWLETQDGKFEPAVFETLARKTILVNHHIRSITLAPQDVISSVYPLAGNEAAIGLRYADHYDEVDDVIKARLQRIPVLAGPIQLVEGGRALIFRIPVYIHDDATYWGILGVITHIDSITQASGVGAGAVLQVGLRKPTGELIGGDASVFEREPVLSDVQVPGGSWQLGAIPANGWPRTSLGASPFLYFGLFGGALMAGMLALLGASLRRSDRQNAALHEEVQVRKTAEEGLKIAGAAFSSSSEAIVIMDSAFRVMSVNAAFTDISGYAESEVVGAVLPFLDPHQGDGGNAQGIVASLSGAGRWRGEIVNLRKSGERYPTWVTINAVASGNGAAERYVAVCSDISAIKQTEQELDRLAHFDILTALPNRLLFRRRLVQDIGAATRDSFCALLLLDIDGFKSVNDSFGHHVGDRLLRDIASRLLGCVRARDTVARLGGDEFAVILTGLDSRDTVVEAASRIISDLQVPFNVDDILVHVSVSIGIACCPEDGADEVLLTRNADAAMYAAKEGGRSTYRFYRWEMTRAVRDRLLLEQRMRQGLDMGHFEVWFQPRVDMRTRRIIGAEGLVRWRDPERGLISPVEFIPLAERSSLIHKLGDTVIRQTVAHADRWHAAGLPFGKLSINVATPQIERGDLASELQGILADTRVPPSALEIEVTESVFMADAERARTTLNGIRALGLSIAIDDFGTGYSSLAYLKTLPVNHLKIDRAFVRDLPDEANDAAIVRAIISMSRSLGFLVTAEGIETPAQFAFLENEGCQFGQGYLFYKPMPAAEFEVLLMEAAREAATAPAG
ncbi:EAL domain-containing protein [Pelomonas sp. P7]|uniref:EAL domain-containing protein n=1 Tax=Pelomonas caseinilytica TaxID=2906763 RepID=A0ABS8XP32_9BURK|nr:EAL domain-containing protein [Pelomonas sp. P7]MCE4540389.1 EAL domain-containing protein [Pelomonas sp. P7]